MLQNLAPLKIKPNPPSTPPIWTTALVFIFSLQIVGSEETRLLVYNLKNFHLLELHPDASNSKGIHYKKTSEAEAVIDVITEAHPEIIGICELGTKKDLYYIQTQLRKAGLSYPFSEFVEASDTYRHLALLSMHPITRSLSRNNLTYQIGNIHFPLSRGLLHVEITIEDQKLQLIGVHLKSKRPLQDSDEALMRLKESHLVRKVINQTLTQTPKAKLIVYGDLNDYYNSNPVKAIKGKYGTRQYLSALSLTDQHNTHWTHYWESPRLYSTLDYVLITHSLKPKVRMSKSSILNTLKTSIASDHRPLLVTLNLVDAKKKPH